MYRKSNTMTSRIIRSLVFGLFLSTNLGAQQGAELFNHTSLHEIRIYFESSDYWDILEDNYHDHIDDSGVEVPYLEAIMQIDGHVLNTVGIRQKGLSSNYSSSEFKKPFKVDLNIFSDGQEYDGIKKFNLHNGAADPSMMRDFLAYNIHRTAGTPAPRVSHCKLFINDEYWGLYGIIEQIDKTFLNNNFADASGTLIKNIGWSELNWVGQNPFLYQQDFQLKTNEDEDDWSDFIEFLDVLNNSSDDEFPLLIEEVFNVDRFLHVLAVDVLTNNWDSYLDNERNWYLYHNPATDKFEWIPWDYNLSMGGTFSRKGNPFPPVDSACMMKSRFEFIQNNQSFLFLDKSNPPAESWYWDFGDGVTSNEQNPVHIFTGEGDVEICLTASRTQNGIVCEQMRCQKINLDFNPSDCMTAANGLSPYPATDPIFQQVISEDDYCCNSGWDALCEVQYYNILLNTDTVEQSGVDYDLDIPLIINNPDKVLIDRLLSVPSFLERYQEIVCIIKETNFNAERLFPLMDAQVELIRAGIYEDKNYNFTRNYFEYDAGNGTGGGNGAKIPALKWVLENRFNASSEDLSTLGFECSNVLSSLSFQDVSINEFMASNDEDSGITDNAGESEDWIELFNNTNTQIDLSNYYLTDEIDKPKKWKFPEGAILESESYLVVWADKDELQDGFHTNFKLSKSGEFIMLSHQDGTVIDSLTFSQQITNKVSARIPNGIGEFVFQIPTFETNNEIINSVAEIVKSEFFEIFPNPATDFFYVSFKTDIDKEKIVSMYNNLGQLVWQKEDFGSSKLRIPTLDFISGLYVLEIQMGERKWRQKVALKH